MESEKNNTTFSIGDKVYIAFIAGPPMIVVDVLSHKAKHIDDSSPIVQCGWFNNNHDYVTTYIPKKLLVKIT